jgi:O-antigen/teichoic acid export membrane protein
MLKYAQKKQLIEVNYLNHLSKLLIGDRNSGGKNIFMAIKQILLPVKRFDSQGILRTGSAMSIVRAVNILSGIALTILLARGLGIGGYGKYVFALTVVSMLSLPIQMGLPTLLMRQLAIYRSQGDWAHLAGIIRWSTVFTFITFVAVGLAAICYYAAFLGLPLQASDTFFLYFLALLLAGLLCFMQLSSAKLRGFERVFWGSIPDGVIRPLLFLFLVFGAQFLFELSPALVMGLHGVAVFVALIWANFVFKRYCLKEQPLNMVQNSAEFQSKTWLRSLLPLSLITGAAVINSKLDLFMLGVLSSKANVGIYSVSIQIAGVIVIGQTIVNAIIAPKIARIYANGEKLEVQRLVTHACQLSFMAALACLVVIVFFGQSLVHMFFGMDFSAAYYVALVASIGYVFSTCVGPVGIILNMTGNERTTARVVMFSAVMNAALNLVLIPNYGAIGAATATLVTVLVIQSFLWRAVLIKTGIQCDVTTFFWRARLVT